MSSDGRPERTDNRTAATETTSVDAADEQGQGEVVQVEPRVVAPPSANGMVQERRTRPRVVVSRCPSLAG